MKKLLLTTLIALGASATAEASTWAKIKEDARWLLDDGYIMMSSNWATDGIYTMYTKSQTLGNTKYVRCIEMLSGRHTVHRETCYMLLSAEEAEKRAKK